MFGVMAGLSCGKAIWVVLGYFRATVLLLNGAYIFLGFFRVVVVEDPLDVPMETTPP